MRFQRVAGKWIVRRGRVIVIAESLREAIRKAVA